MGPVEQIFVIRQFVTFHFVIPTEHLHKNGFLTSAQASEYTIVNCSQTLNLTQEIKTSKTYRKLHHLTYPINTMRNVARVSATSHYIFPSDLELYPSPGLIPQFLKLVTEGKYIHNPLPVLKSATNICSTSPTIRHFRHCIQMF